MKENKKDRDEDKGKNRVSVYVDDELHERFRIKVLRGKSSMQEVLEDLVRKFSDGVEVSPREVAEDEHDTYVGFVNWLRDQQEFDLWGPLVQKWTDRGRRIRSAN